MRTAELLRRRLGASQRGGDRPASAREVVAHLGALQAQDYGQSLWAVGSRTQRPRRSAVEAELAAGALVRTWPMRGTLHLVRPEDVRWMIGLSAARTHRAAAGRFRQLGITPADRLRAEDVVGAALEAGPQTRAQLFATLAEADVSTEGQRGIHLVGHLARSGLLVVGPRVGKQPTYVALTTPPATGSRDEWLAELARRYVRGHGPVTDRDLAWWTGLTLADSRAALASLGGELRWDGPLAYVDGPVPPMPRGPLLLAGFDEYVLAYADRAAVLGETPFESVVPGSNGVFLPTVVRGGRVVGTWRRDRLPTSADAAVRRWSAFLDKPIGVSRAASDPGAVRRWSDRGSCRPRGAGSDR